MSGSESRRRFLRRTIGSAVGIAAAPAVAWSRARTLTVAAGGDAIITRRLHETASPEVAALLNIFQRADAGFFNCEMTFHNAEGYPAPTGSCGDLNLIGDPRIAMDLRRAGFNLTTLANNHTLDYGHDGLLATLKHLHSAGIVVAGAGANLAEARAPRYLDTANGRVALVGCASTFRVGSEASPAHAEIRGRPGLNPLRVRRIYELPADQLASLRATQQLLPGGGNGQAAPDELRFLGNDFRVGSRPQVVVEADERDIRAITVQVTRARAEADVVLVTIHAHESGGNREEPACFLQPFARACIDAGAHAFFGHGPHVIRGLEMYRGCPIFYSLGNLYFQAETIWQIPQEIYDTCELPPLAPSGFFHKVMPRSFDAPGPAADAIWEAVVPNLRFRDGRLEALTLYPVDLFRTLPPTLRGTAGLAAGDVAARILERQQRLSRPFGTTITVRGAVGNVGLA